MKPNMLNLVALSRLVASLLTAGTLLGCCGDRLNKRQIEKWLTNELSVGDSREKVESVLRKGGLHISYDKYRKRYGSTVRSDCDRFRAISVYVQLSDAETVQDIKVFESFTMPLFRTFNEYKTRNNDSSGVRISNATALRQLVC